jgi:UDP-galactopyranose mutase
MKYDYMIVGAGFAGSVIAERIASQLNKKVIIIEKRNHIAGNAYDEFDEHGILIHRYGPHIFHTNSKEVFDYLSQFTEWFPYEHKVLANIKNKLYPIPINRITINKLYNLNLKSDKEVEVFFEKVREKRNPIINSEDIIVNQVGIDLFEKFFRYYTKKQWNLEPNELSPAVCGRIPVRTNDDCRYFTDKVQFMPKDGFTEMFKKILSNKNIELVLNTDYKSVVDSIKFDKLIYTGPADYFFDYIYGRLPYRSIRFDFRTVEKEYYQEAAVINYVEPDVPFTRVCEYKYLTGQVCKKTSLSFEYPEQNGDPYYPTLTENSKAIFSLYEKEIEKLKNVSFAGRLATFRYYNMDQIVAFVLKNFNKIVGYEKK